MTSIVPFDEAQARLKELIHQLAPGDELVITENHRPVATLVGGPKSPAPPDTTGSRTLQGDDHVHDS